MHTVNVNGANKELSNIYTNIGGVWKEYATGYDCIGGAWKEFPSSGVPMGELAVGTSVFMNLGGVSYEWLIIYKGNPNTSIYDSSCNGIWLILKNIYTTMRWSAAGKERNGYCDSEIHTYLNGTFLNLFDSAVKGIIKSVKIPYVYGTSNSAALTGSNGLSTKVFLLSAVELGINNPNSYDNEGTKLSYFSSNTPRIAYYNDTAAQYLTRTTYKTNTSYIMMVSNKGGATFTNSVSRTYGIRPAIILPSNTLVDGDMNVKA